jgi:hypothetical protein
LRFVYLILLVAFGRVQSFGQPELRSAVIQYHALGINGCLNISYEVDVIISSDVDYVTEDSLLVDFGDGLSGHVFKVDSVSIEANKKKLTYRRVHSYSGCSAYTITCQDFPSISGINFNNDWNMVVQALVIHNPLLVNEHSPELTSLVINGDLETDLVESLIAYDAEGDSVSFGIYEPTNIDGYSLPNGVSVTEDGVFSWISPQTVGSHLLIFEVTEWRSNTAIGKQYLPMLVNIEDVLGLNERVEAPFALIIHPNPTTSAFTIAWPSRIQNGYRLSMYDAQGRAVKPPTSLLSDGSMEVDMHSLAPGIYLGRLMVGDPSTSSGQGFKVVKQ